MYYDLFIVFWADVAELVDALVSGISGATRGSSSLLIGTFNFTILNSILILPYPLISLRVKIQLCVY